MLIFVSEKKWPLLLAKGVGDRLTIERVRSIVAIQQATEH